MSCDLDPDKTSTIQPDDGEGVERLEANGRDNERVQANLQHALANFNLGFDAARELDFCGRIQRNGTTTGASLLATVADYQNTRVSLTAEVAHTALTP